MSEITAGPPMRGAPWFRPPMRTPLPTPPAPPPRPVYAPEVRTGPPMHGAPWFHGFVQQGVGVQPKATPAPPAPQAIAPEVRGGPPMRGAPWFHGFVEAGSSLASRPVPPAPPPPAFLAHVKPFVPRVPDAGDRRAARHTEIVAAILNSLLGQGILVQTGPESYTLDVGVGTGGLTGTFSSGSHP